MHFLHCFYHFQNLFKGDTDEDNPEGPCNGIKVCSVSFLLFRIKKTLVTIKHILIFYSVAQMLNVDMKF